jgi:hypothetical protein
VQLYSNFLINGSEELVSSLAKQEHSKTNPQECSKKERFTKRSTRSRRICTWKKKKKKKKKKLDTTHWKSNYARDHQIYACT